MLRLPVSTVMHNVVIRMKHYDLPEFKTLLICFSASVRPQEGEEQPQSMLITFLSDIQTKQGKKTESH